MPDMAVIPQVHVYDREPLARCLSDILPLARRHFAETSRFKERGLTPDVSIYERIESAGKLRIFTLRTIPGALIGYCVMVVGPHHHSDQVRAVEDLLFIVPEQRGRGARFIRWIDQQLKAEGARVVYRSVQVTHNHGPMYARQGYTKTEETWSREL